RRATPEAVLEESPDVVVVATGARPSVPDIPGLNLPHVYQAWEVLKGKIRLEDPVVIIGGNAVGLETALYVASHGTLSPETLYFLFTNNGEDVDSLREYCSKGNKRVTVIEMLSKAGKDIGQSTRWTVFAELKRLGVETLTNAKAVERERYWVLIEVEGEKRRLEAGSVILAVGSLPENELYTQLLERHREVYLIGDAQKIGKAIDAVREGFELGLRI
ncbi:MAG: FAD-dependent oxidoreductase, partial [Desulfatiglandales bacterium]